MKRNARIRCTANRADEEPHRIERLEEVVKCCPPNVIALHDHKGVLSVNWSTPPTIEDLTAVVQAWALQAEWSLNHYVCGVEVAIDCPGYNPFEIVGA